jgi:nucleoside-diphosphate-sugar epimerase
MSDRWFGVPMQILVLGGTAWLGRLIASTARQRGHEVTALARGRSGPAPPGVALVEADRTLPGAYDDVAQRRWDAVVDVGRQPSHTGSALEALEGGGSGGGRAHWVFVSSCSVYADHDQPGAAEDAALLAPATGDDDGWETYGARKVACEELLRGALAPDRLAVLRSGLIAGPGDHTDRTGYWPLRFAHPATDDGSVLAVDSPLTTQVVDVRDLAAWVVHVAESAVAGTFNASGPQVPLVEHLAEARRVTGHTGDVVGVSPDWLVEHEVQPWSGPRSLPLWLPLPEYAGFMARDTSAAEAAGLVCRPLAETLEDTLGWEVRQGPGRPRQAGLAPAEERRLVEQARRA